MKKVWEKTFFYAFFRPYVDWFVKNTYSKIEVKGLENIPDPQSNSVIITPNHCNTLMDALVVLQARKAPTCFVARADIFQRPGIANILNKMRILPIYRSRDCSDSRFKNKAVFENCVDSMNHGIAFCIYPEGTHRARRSLMPVKKGAFRIASLSVETNPGRPVYIVPAGIDYDDYYNIMRPVKVTFGEPVLFTGEESPEVLSDKLYGRISELITFFPDDEHLAEAEAALYESKRIVATPWHWVLAAAAFPVFLLSGFLCLPMLLGASYLFPRIKDKAWLNTMRFSLKLVLTPFTVIGAAVAGFIHLPWFMALVLVAATLFAHPVFYYILAFYKRLSRRKRA